ncbi:LysR family transcriptional regulator [Salinicola halophyticus]|uniref:LysR family transcriptional regulator n=1 Tax=Salinicola halophyticus TaxID=1808881 RepID=UPI003F488732
MDSIHGITVFVQVAEARSFAKAGRQLGLSASAVGKSIARLEDRLGGRLLHRSTRSMTLTAEGVRFLERSRRILAEMDAAQAEFDELQRAPRGRLRLSLPIAGALMLPVLSDFMHRYPEIELDLDFTDRVVDVIEEGFDAVIRAAKPVDSRLTARRLGSFRLMLVGAPEYFRRHGKPDSAAALADHHCLHYRYSSSGRLETWPLFEADSVALPTSMVCNNLDAHLRFTLDGHGIACLPDFAICNALDDGRLESVLTDTVSRDGAFYALWPSSKHPTPKTRALIDHLSEQMAMPNHQTRA